MDDLRLVWDPALQKGPHARESRPRYDRFRGGPSTDPRLKLEHRQPRRGKRSGLDLSHRHRPVFAAPVPEHRHILVSGFGPLASCNDVHSALTLLGLVVDDCRLIADPQTGASLGAAIVLLKTNNSAANAVRAAKAGKLWIVGQNAMAELEDVKNSKEAAYVQRTMSLKAAANAAAAIPPPSDTIIDINLNDMSVEKRREWLLWHIGTQQPYLFVRARMLNPRHVSARQVDADLIGRGCRPIKILATRQGWYLVFGGPEQTLRAQRVLNQRIIGVPLKIDYTEEVRALWEHGNVQTTSNSHIKEERDPSLASAARPKRDGSETHTNRVDDAVAELSSALKSSIRSQIVLPYIRELVSDMIQRPLVPSHSTSMSTSSAASTAAVLGEIKFRKRSHANKRDIEMSNDNVPKSKMAKLKNKLREKVDNREADAVQLEVGRLASTEALVSQTDLGRSAVGGKNQVEKGREGEEDDDVDDDDDDDDENDFDKDAEMEVASPATSPEDSKTAVMEEDDWDVHVGPYPLPVALELPEKLGTATLLQGIIDEEDLAFFKKAAVATDVGKPPSTVDARKLITRSIEREDNHVRELVRPSAPRPWRLLGADAWPPSLREQWRPPQRPGEPLDVVQWCANAEWVVPTAAAAAAAAAQLAEEDIGDVQTAERERRERRTRERQFARALSYNKRMYGMNTSLFMSSGLAKSTKKLKLARSAIHDWGLYAGEPITRRDFVVEYVGETLRDEFADVRERQYLMQGIDSSYLFRIDWDIICDATKRGNLARFINHSCQPNMVARIIRHDGQKCIALYALRDIIVNEELTFDYKFVSEDGEERVRCRCGASKCRGFLV